MKFKIFFIALFVCSGYSASSQGFNSEKLIPYFSYAPGNNNNVNYTDYLDFAEQSNMVLGAGIHYLVNPKVGLNVEVNNNFFYKEYYDFSIPGQSWTLNDSYKHFHPFLLTNVDYQIPYQNMIIIPNAGLRWGWERNFQWSRDVFSSDPNYYFQPQGSENFTAYQSFGVDFYFPEDGYFMGIQIGNTSPYFSNLPIISIRGSYLWD
jgi:hypothetical protein